MADILADVDSGLLELLNERDLAAHFDSYQTYDAFVLKLQDHIDDMVDLAGKEAAEQLALKDEHLVTLAKELKSAITFRNLAERAQLGALRAFKDEHYALQSVAHSKWPIVRWLTRFVRWPDPIDPLLADQIRTLDGILAEMHRQDEKWGADRKHPNGTGPEWKILRDSAQAETDLSFDTGTGTWLHILQEEVLEAFAETNPKKLRVELEQAGAVIAQWITALNRQKK